jgi:protein-S-isoprenylcysteine O-methyltransferase Ste14
MPGSIGAAEHESMNRFLTLSYGAISYLLFLVTFVYAILFVGGLVVPRTVDDAISGPLGQAVVVDLVLLTLFALQHSVMARPAFKRWWTRYVPQPIERSTYVLLASLVLGLLLWQWRSIPAVVWDVTRTPVTWAVWALFWLGWAIVLASTFMISHFELFGLRQVFAVWRRTPQTETGFRTTLFYRVVRHPLNFGFIVAFWSAPTMTVGHLLFAGVTTGWILIAMQLEEHDLALSLGARYAAYRESVPMLIPGLRKRTPDSGHGVVDGVDYSGTNQCGTYSP